MKRPAVFAVCALLLASELGAAGPELLVGSWATHSVRRYNPVTGDYLGDFVTPGSGGLSRPDGLAWGADGHLYVASSLSNQVLRYVRQTGAFMDVFAGPAAGLVAPGNLQFGPDGRLYVCNKGTHQVLRFDPLTGAPLGVFAQGGGMLQPVGLAWADGLLYVSGFTSGGVFRYDDQTGAPAGVLTMDVTTPLILRVGEAGDLYVTSCNQASVRRYDRGTGALLGIISGGGIACPVGHLLGPDGSLIVASWGNGRLLRFNQATGASLGTLAVGNGLAQPNDLLLTLDEGCYPDCNTDGALTIADFGCFQSRFAAGDPYADCNASGTLTIADFACFQGAFVKGCP